MVQKQQDGSLIFEENLQKEKIDLSTEVIPYLVNKIIIFHNNNYHRDIGDLESYSLAQIETLEYFKDRDE